ncbi:MAG: 50S ribosomal protein L5 [Candidatus Margulisiibacteriota bacterium]|jgi:large subunit ribosomal protein L5
MTTIDLKEKYLKEIVPKMVSKFGYKNVHQVPKVTKVVLNRGVGEAIENIKALENSIDEFTRITGQKPTIRRSKKSIATFKLREKQPIGVKVTLRGKMMYGFLNKFINICLPKVRDFRGVPAKLDGNGNYTLGVKEQIIFPEVVFERIDKIRGMDVTVVTTAKTDAEAKELLTLMGVPFRN